MTRRGEHAAHVWSVIRSGAAARSDVAASWRRSALRHGLDPEGGRQAERVEERRLRLAREANADILQAAAPFLDRLSRALVRPGRCLLVTDRNGLILDGRMSRSDEALFRSARLIPGEDWSEAAEGTNGIGTCLAEERRLTIFRDEHFRAANTGLACTDVPIFGAGGEIVAALDVSTARFDDDRATAALILSLLVEAARGIERRLLQAAFPGCRLVLVGEAAGGPELVAVDRDDLIVGASRAARRRPDLAGVSESCPVPLADILGMAEEDPLLAAERRVLRQALARSRGNAAAAARSLGIGRATLYRRMQRAGLQPSELPAR
ncbi:MAG: helix-turn-helix domain-containing protein [Sphingomonadaceae bacterium]